MKRSLIFTFVLSILLLSLWFPGLTHPEQHERPIVRIVYFVPSDLEPQPDIDAKLDTLIKNTQRFYADQMEAHGFERKTFLFETDARGKAVVHHIKGKFTDIEYRTSTKANYWQEISEKLDFPSNDIRLLMLESAELFNIFGIVKTCGFASVSYNGGSASINNDCFDVRTLAHELGHIFGLNHDWRAEGKWIHASEVTDPMTTSFCAAEWLDVHPAFHTSGNSVSRDTTVKMLSPSLTTPDNAIRLRFEVTDPDGIHQVQLITPGRDKFSSLFDFKGLNGTPGTTVEFITTELTPVNQGNLYSVKLHIIDINGNVLWTDYYPINVSFLLPPSEVVSSPDPHSEVIVRFGIGGPLPTHTTWSLPEGAKARLGKGGILGVAYSPDGTRIAVASSIGTWLYDTQTYQAISLFTGHTSSVNSVAFSPDGQTLASGSQDKTIRFWDVSTGNLLQTLEGHRYGVQSVGFSPDGQTLASEGYGIIHLWDVSTGNLLHTLMDTPTDLSSLIPISLGSVVFSPDGQTLASARGLNAFTHLWDVRTGKRLHTLKGHRGTVESIAFSPDGQTLASGSTDATIRLWNVGTGRHLYTITSEEGVNRVAFSPNGQILASGHGYTIEGSDGGTIILWDVSTGKSVHTLTGHTYYITSVAFSPNGQTLASASGDGTLRFWNARTGQSFHTITDHIYNVHNVAFSPDGQTLASASGSSHGGSDNAIHLWDIGTGSLHYALTGHTFHWVDLSPDGRTLVSGSQHGAIGLWDVDTGSLRNTLTGHAEVIRSISFSPNGKTLVSTSYDGVIGLWDIRTGSLLRSIIPSVPIHSVVFSPDGQTIAGASGYTDTENIGLDRGDIILWDVDTGNLLDTFTRRSDYFTNIAFSPDGQTLASGSYWGSVLLWDAATGTLKNTLTGYTDTVRSVAFSPDGQTLASGGWNNATIYLWDIKTGENIKTFIGHTTDVNSVVFSPDGQTLASGSYDGTVLLWEVMPTSAVPERVKADVNGDSEVNIQDLVAVAAALGKTGENDADVNGDGKVNIQDLVAVAGAFGQAAAGAPSALHYQARGQLTAADVQQWLTKAQALNLTDPTSLRGIHFLEQLLAALTPKETALLPNYPNPFNPETWIPYQLAQPADVTLTIYDIKGHAVRDLDLGHQRAGIYQSRNRAAYWDGRNAVGEPVASGVYFYTLTAGDFSATRKMLIRK